MSSQICIIGAGPAGLVAARALAEQGLAYTHLERNAGLGGVWDIDAPGSPMYESAHLISSRTRTSFSGFEMPDDYPDYPSHRLILAYLRAFADHFGLTDRIRFNTEVTGLARHGEGWRVTLANGTVEEFTAVIVCPGEQWDPVAAEVPGFDGEVRHSNTYRSADELRGKRVLVVGAGNSGCDIACDAATTAEAASISMRRGYWFVPKHVFGIPSDVFGGRISWLPKRAARSVLQPFVRLIVGDLTRLGFQKPTHRLFETHPIMNDQLLHHVSHGDVTPRPGIRSAEGKRITFTDGTSDEFDLVLLAIGYRRSVPFAQELFGDPQHPDNLYLDAFSTQHPGLCAVGFIESNSGSYGLLDRQAYLVAGYLAERAAGSEKAARFEERIRQDRPDLTSGIKFDASPRHQGYVDADAFVAHTDAVATEFGWERTALKKTKGRISTTTGRP